MTREEQIEQLLANPDNLKKKKPFFRELRETYPSTPEVVSDMNKEVSVSPPDIKVMAVTQEKFMKELDPASHDVLFDDSIPSITAKLSNGTYVELKHNKMSVPFQRLIKNKQVLHLTGNPLQHTLMSTNPSEEENDNFITFKQYWKLRNMDGMKHKMVDTQKSYGDAGLLFYYDYKGRVKCKVLSFKDGYVLCPHNDENGDRMLESVVYMSDGVEYIDSYDDKYMYRYSKSSNSIDNKDNEWVMEKRVEHGFDEIPLITKRGSVAWDAVQNVIEIYEVIYNVFMAIQKRYGWGILYIKGNFDDKAKKIAGNIILNDNSINGTGDAKFLAPPSPDHIIETLGLLEETIQKGSCTTFILPKDIRLSGDISGIAISLTQSLDIENALQDCIEWQNVADKMVRLFKYGLSKELVNTDKKKDAVTKFAEMDIHSEFRVWKPMNEAEYNQMITVLTGAGILSKESGIELNTLSKPDEKIRVGKEKEIETETVVEEDVNKTQIGFNTNNNVQ